MANFKELGVEDGILKGITEMGFENATTVQEKVIPGDVILKDTETDLLNKINFVPISIEKIIQQCEAPIQAINVVLTQLELADRIENKNGKISLKAGSK